MDSWPNKKLDQLCIVGAGNSGHVLIAMLGENVGESSKGFLHLPKFLQKGAEETTTAEQAEAGASTSTRSESGSKSSFHLPHFSKPKFLRKKEDAEKTTSTTTSETTTSTTPPPVDESTESSGDSKGKLHFPHIPNIFSFMGESKPKVVVLAPFEDDAARLKKAIETNGGIAVDNCAVEEGSKAPEIIGKPDLITKDAKTAIEGSQIIFIAVPAYKLEETLKMIEPFVPAGAWVGCVAGQTGFQWIAGSILDAADNGKADNLNGKGIKLFGFDKLPYSCRVDEFGVKVKVRSYRKSVGVACIPRDEKVLNCMTKEFSRIFSHCKFHPLESFLSVTLAPIHQIINPARMLGLFEDEKNRQREKVPLFYEDMDDISADLILQVSDEFQNLVKGIELKEKPSTGVDGFGLLEVPSIDRAVQEMYDEIGDNSSLKEMFKTNAQLKGILTPMRQAILQSGETEQDGQVEQVEQEPIPEESPTNLAGNKALFEIDWESRFFQEDVPALVVARSIAEMYQVAMPTVERIIRWIELNSPTQQTYILPKDWDSQVRFDTFISDPVYWGLTTREALVQFHGLE